MKKYTLYIILGTLIFSLISSYYYGVSYADSFLNHSYIKRKNHCKFLINNNTKNLSEKYAIADSCFIRIGQGKYQFEALDLSLKSKEYIILVHGKRECPYAMIRGGIRLQKMGFSVLIPVLFSHGSDSLNNIIDYGKYSISQIDKCVSYLVMKGAKHIGISGRSMGASISIIAAAKNKQIDAIAAECPLSSVKSSISYKHKLYSNLPSFPFLNIKTMAVQHLLDDNLDSLAAEYFVKRISPRPFLLMAATNDQVVDPNDSYKIYHLAGEPKVIWEEPVNHTKFHSQLKDEFYIRIPNFFKKAFLEKE